MFHRHHEAVDHIVVGPARVNSVRVLETEAELMEAIERASAFERTRAERGGGRALTYERYSRERPDGFADVVPIAAEAASA